MIGKKVKVYRYYGQSTGKTEFHDNEETIKILDKFTDKGETKYLGVCVLSKNVVHFYPTAIYSILN